MGKRTISLTAAILLGCLAAPQGASGQPSGAAGATDPAPLAASTWPSDSAIQFTNWVVASGDNGGLPFIVVDKIAGNVFVFDTQSQLAGATPALFGSALGDESDAGIGDRELAAIAPEKRTTPAGRFVASYGPAHGHRQVLWVDFSTAVSLHPVVTANRKERRLQRLESPSPDDNRITYGCINVPKDFYAKVVQPLFADTKGIVYILPETKPVSEVFLAYRGLGQ